MSTLVLLGCISIFIACVGAATILTGSVNGGDIKVGCVVLLSL